MIKSREVGFPLRDAGLVALGFAQFDQRQTIVEFALHALEIAERALQRLALAHNFLSVCWF